MIKYEYNGPVMIFSQCVSTNWKATTYAVSEKKARNNMTYQYKKQNNMNLDTRVVLPGEVKSVLEGVTNG